MYSIQYPNSIKIQLPLDSQLARKKGEDSVDWVEIETSLIKEFGMTSVKEIKQAFPKMALYRALSDHNGVEKGVCLY